MALPLSGKQSTQNSQAQPKWPIKLRFRRPVVLRHYSRVLIGRRARVIPADRDRPGVMPGAARPERGPLPPARAPVFTSLRPGIRRHHGHDATHVNPAVIRERGSGLPDQDGAGIEQVETLTLRVLLGLRSWLGDDDGDVAAGGGGVGEPGGQQRGLHTPAAVSRVRFARSASGAVSAGAVAPCVGDGHVQRHLEWTDLPGRLR